MIAAPWATEALGFGIVGADGESSAEIAALVQPGLRRNPRRAHLLVSPVLGKHIPAEPTAVIAAGERLADAVAVFVGGPVDVLGMAETATGLGGCVAARLDAPVYVHTTRRPTQVPSYVEFEEGHSHATHHAVRPTSADLMESEHPLVIVDDETSTGATALAAIVELHRRHPRRQYVLASLVDMRTAEHLADADRMASRLGTRIGAVSLAAGRVVLPAGLIDAVHALSAPQLNPIGQRRGGLDRLCHRWPADVPDGGRHGVLGDEAETFGAAAARVADDVRRHLDVRRPVLVIGHEELMYLPLRIADYLAHQGFLVRFQSTTRSPAYVHDVDGYPLRRGYQFSACEAEQAEPRYLYNGWPDDGVKLTQYVLVVDAVADTPNLAGPGGIEDVLTAAGHDLLTVVVDGADPAALVEARTMRR